MNAFALPASCDSNGTGLAIAAISGGQPPYFIQWSTGANVDSIRAVNGTYYVSVLDAEGTALSDSANIACLAFVNGLTIKSWLSGFYDPGADNMRATIDPINMDTIADSIIVVLADTSTPFASLYQGTSLLGTNGWSYVHFLKMLHNAPTTSCSAIGITSKHGRLLRPIPGVRHGLRLHRRIRKGVRGQPDGT